MSAFFIEKSDIVGGASKKEVANRFYSDGWKYKSDNNLVACKSCYEHVGK